MRLRKILASDVRTVRLDDVEQYRWFALRTRVGKEFVAELLLLRAGHVAFNPVEMVDRRISRYRRHREPKPRPMLTSMVLVGFEGDPPWWDIFRLNVVTAVIGTSEGPTMISHKAVRRMVRLTGGAADLRRPVYKPEVGDRVVITSGPFDGLAGRIVECTNKRARMLLDLPDAAYPIEAPVEILSQAS